MKNTETEAVDDSKQPEKTSEVPGFRGVLLSGAANWWAALLVALITFVVFLPALNNGFVNYDDGVFVYDNKHIVSLNLDFIKWAFTNREYQWSP